MSIHTILKHDLEIIDIKDFKNYFKELLRTNKFDGFSKKAFLKAIDIPPAYFLEQPEDTQVILLDNKEDRINSLEKYVGKCLVILWKDGIILNVCRMDRTEAEDAVERLSTIEDVEGIIWDKTFYKDGYIQGYIPVGEVSKDGYNKCLMIDFPILLNKVAKMHEAFFKLADGVTAVDRDLIYYNSSLDIDFSDYQHIALAIEDGKDVVSKKDTKPMNKNYDTFILREVEEVICALVEEKIIPKNLISGITGYINRELEGVQLTVNKLSEVILNFEGNLKTIKQLTNLRRCYESLFFTFTEVIEEKDLTKA